MTGCDSRNADEMYLYSLGDSSVKASVSYQSSRDIKILSLNGGYALITYETGDKSSNNNGGGAMMGGNTSSQNGGYNCYLYDENLNLINTVSVGNQILGTEVITVSHDGKKIAYSGAFETSIMVIDVSTGQTSQVIDLKNTNSGILALEYLMFSADNSTLGFKGQLENPIVGEQSLPTYGSVGIDGSNANNYTSNDYAIGDGSVMAGSTLLLPEDARILTGRIKLFDTSTAKTSLVNLKSTKETDGKAFISDNGNYFATGELKNNNSFVVRIYSIDGTLLNTATIDNMGEEYFYRGSKVVISENSRTAIISLANWNTDVNTNMYTFGF